MVLTGFEASWPSFLLYLGAVTLVGLCFVYPFSTEPPLPPLFQFQAATAQITHLPNLHNQYNEINYIYEFIIGSRGDNTKNKQIPTVAATTPTKSCEMSLAFITMQTFCAILAVGFGSCRLIFVELIRFSLSYSVHHGELVSRYCFIYLRTSR